MIPAKSKSWISVAMTGYCSLLSKRIEGDRPEDEILQVVAQTVVLEGWEILIFRTSKSL